MATNTEELTNCIICTATFTDPQVLPCDHTFCKSCVDRLTEAGTLKCPKCKNVCPRGDVRYDFRLNTFLEALAERTEHLTRASRMDVLNKSLPTPATETCEVCESSTVASFCHQCQQWLCTSCRTLHVKQTATKHHVHTGLVVSYAIAKHRLDQQIKKLREKAEAVTKVVEQNEKTMTEVEVTRMQARQQSQKLRADLLDNVNKYVDVIELQIDGFGHQELAFIVEENMRLDEKRFHLNALLTKMEELRTQPDNEVLVAAKSMISRAEDAASFQADDTVSMPRLSVTRNPGWSVDGALKVRLLSAESRQIAEASDARPLHLAEVAAKQWRCEKQTMLDSPTCASMRVINDQLWCCTANGISVLEDDADTFRVNLILPSGRLGNINDVAKLSDGSIVIAANGLYQASITGLLQQRLSSVSVFTSVAVYHGNIYAAAITTDNKNVVYVLKQSGDGWHKAYSFKVTSDSWVTLSVQNNVIKCCSRRKDKIMVYDLTGKHLRTYGAHGTDDAGEFNSPYICDDGAEGSLLLADNWNQRLQVMRLNGECRVLQLQPPAFGHRSAAMFKNDLYLTTFHAGSNGVLYRYRCT